MHRMRRWQDTGLTQRQISVNMSIRQFQRRDIIDTVSGIIKETAMDPAYLQVELTESVFMINAQSSGELLNGLKMLGVQLAIDDFGTGCEPNDAAIVQARFFFSPPLTHQSATERLRRGSDTIPTLSSAE